MAETILKLIVEKGPREGETLLCTRRSKIRIGRVVKGNTFTIKDAGISSKHLLIEFKDGLWVVVDLDTSNGTILNDTQLEGMKAYEVKDGDVIKIGEWTSLKVGIEGEGLKSGKTGSKKVGKASIEVEEDVEQLGKNGGEEESLDSIAVNRPRRGAPRCGKGKKVDALPEAQKIETVGEKGNFGLESCGEQENVVNQPRRRGRQKKVEAKEIEVEKFEEGEKVANVVVAEEKRTTSAIGEKLEGHILESIAVNRPRRGARRAVKATTMEVISVSETQEVGDNKGLDDVAPKRRGATKKTKDAPVVSEVPTISEMSNFDQESKEKGDMVGRSGKAAQQVQVPVSDDPMVPGTLNPQKVWGAIDLEKMTLGEWFDYLEVYLPNQIHQATDAINSSMREQSKKFNKFVLEHPDLKGKLSIS